VISRGAFCDAAEVFFLAGKIVSSEIGSEKKEKHRSLRSSVYLSDTTISTLG
jgi:hypothetical protein